MYKTLDWKIAYKTSLHFIVAAKLLSSAVKLEFSMLEPSNDRAAWLPPIWWPHRFSEQQKEMGREAVTVPISRRGPEWTFCCFLFSVCMSVMQPREPIYCTAWRAEKNHQVLRALKLGRLFQKSRHAQVYLSTSVPAMHFYLDGAPQSNLSRRVDVINCLDEYRSIGSLRDLQSSSPLVATICREVNHWVPLGRRGQHPIYSSIQRTPQCGPCKWCL